MSAKRLRIRPRAERDVDDLVVYIAERAGADTALRFYDSAHKTFRTLLATPGLGRVRPLLSGRNLTIHQWAVSGFDKYLIFYQSVVTGVDIVRVLHGARDIDGMIEDDTFGE